MTERAVDHGIQPTGYERRSARFLVSGALLVDALKMPSNTIVVDIRPGPGYDEYEFIVSHPDLPESDEVVECSPLVTHKREEFVWDWNPSEPADRAEQAIYEWTWFEDETLPHRGVYGVRRGSEVVCRTNAYKDGYERAKAIADALNRGEQVDTQ